LVASHEELDFLDGHRIEQHSNELEKQNDCSFKTVASRGCDVSKATCRKSCSHEVYSCNILLAEVFTIDSSSIHPGRFIVGVKAQTDLRASQQMKVDKSLEDKLKNI